MTFWTPQPAPRDEHEDAITVSRQLSPEEATKRLLLARRVMLGKILWPIVAGGVVLMALVLGIATHWRPLLTIGGTLLFGGLLVGAAALGIALGGDVLRRQARYELGDSGELTVAWRATGATVSAANFQRSFRYDEIQWVREVDGHLLLKFAMQMHPSPYLIALPLDLVPAQARQQLAAAGVPQR